VDGGWYGILRVPATQPDEDLAIDLLRKMSVLAHPGHFYDFPADGYLIVSLITATAHFREGITRILGLLNE
jgi:alanine-synthesizing transaminase